MQIFFKYIPVFRRGSVKGGCRESFRHKTLFIRGLYFFLPVSFPGIQSLALLGLMLFQPVNGILSGHELSAANAESIHAAGSTYESEQAFDEGYELSAANAESIHAAGSAYESEQAFDEGYELTQEDRVAIRHIRNHGIALSDDSSLDALIERAGQRRVVLLGESSHGTSEFYTMRTAITRRLIEEYGFDFVVIEGDWPLAFYVNKHVKDLEEHPVSSREVLKHFHRWPQWMWANEETEKLVRWLRNHNRNLGADQQAGFYGMDIYAANDARRAVLELLIQADPAKASAADRFFQCYFRLPSQQSYLQMVHRSGEHCGEDFLAVLSLLERNRDSFSALDSLGYVNARRSALMLKAFERHLRGNLIQGPDSWNYRAEHFYEVLSDLLQIYGEHSRGIVWAHNTHIGDARATDMRNAGMRNIGQIARQELGSQQVYAVGIGTYRGEVLAGSGWESPVERMNLPPARPGSYEFLFQQAGISDAILLFDDPEDHEPLMRARGNRAVGVVYQPDQEAQRNYVPTILPARYDAFLFIEETRALDPLNLPGQ